MREEEGFGGRRFWEVCFLVRGRGFFWVERGTEREGGEEEGAYESNVSRAVQSTAKFCGDIMKDKSWIPDSLFSITRD